MEGQELLEGLLKFQEISDKKRNKELWLNPIDHTSLRETLLRLPKDSLDKIRRNYNLKGVSQLKKAELVDELCIAIPIFYSMVLERVDVELLDLILRISDSKQPVNFDDLNEANKVVLKDRVLHQLRNYGLIFTGQAARKKVLYLPNEIIVAINEISNEKMNQIRNKAKQNSEWNKIIKGLIHYYGVVDTFTLNELMNRFLNEKQHYYEFIDRLWFYCDLYQDICQNSELVFHLKLAFNSREMYTEVNERKDLEYYPFTKAMLISASEAGYIDESTVVSDFRAFLIDAYDMTFDHANWLIAMVIIEIKKGEMPSKIIPLLSKYIEIPNESTLSLIGSFIMELNNTTPLWALKGHRPNDLFRAELKQIERKSNKIGRNDPCPCGSGKKYKKCCGV